MEGICVMVVPMRMGRSEPMPMKMGEPFGNSSRFPLRRVQLVVFGSVFVVFPMIVDIEAVRVFGELPLQGMSMAAVIDHDRDGEWVGLGDFLDRLPISFAVPE